MMKMKSKVPISWKLEEYAFGVVALRDEIQRHKREDKKMWSPFKAIGIRLVFLYAVIATVVLILLITLQNAMTKLLK